MHLGACNSDPWQGQLGQPHSLAARTDGSLPVLQDALYLPGCPSLLCRCWAAHPFVH